MSSGKRTFGLATGTSLCWPGRSLLVLIEKGPRAMRACRFAVVVATVLAIAGCRSGSSGWTWGRKKSSTAMADADPTLPSTGAAPSNYATPYTSAAAAQGTSAFAAPGAPPAAAPGAYDGTPYPDQIAGAAGAPGAAGGAMAQQGPYSQSYGQPPAAAQPPGAYPSTSTPYASQCRASRACHRVLSPPRPPPVPRRSIPMPSTERARRPRPATRPLQLRRRRAIRTGANVSCRCLRRGGCEHRVGGLRQWSGGLLQQSLRNHPAPTAGRRPLPG